MLIKHHPQPIISKTDDHGNPHHDRVQGHPILALTLSQLQKMLFTLIKACSPNERHREKGEACETQQHPCYLHTYVPSSSHATYIHTYPAAPMLPTYIHMYLTGLAGKPLPSLCHYCAIAKNINYIESLWLHSNSHGKVGGGTGEQHLIVRHAKWSQSMPS